VGLASTYFGRLMVNTALPQEGRGSRNTMAGGPSELSFTKNAADQVNWSAALR
jgi:hypothetical protein